MNTISPLAFVNPAAKIGNDVTIDAFAYIDEGVIIGDNCHVRPHASILRGSRIGNNNTIYEGVIIGASPQDFRWKGEKSFVEIGNNNTIREHVIINRSIRENEATVIGNDSFIMAQSHIGHDSVIGNYCVLGNAVKIAGDCKVGNFCILSSNALMHERCEIGEWCLIKGGCRVNSNVPPYVVMAHNPISYSGINAFILRRGKFSEDVIDDIAKCYRHLYQSNTSVFNALRRIEADVIPGHERDSILAFIRQHNEKIVCAPKGE
ncbi:MAG: acyl-ACP--UDP-N-acetylglucosamine O-acyltransferase [Muribaculaceae bacterium]|nr:acyl-ACP--UDP-N-acetylglucosamine O-acyltransferase [Muribaculaceae bacterium]